MGLLRLGFAFSLCVLVSVACASVQSGSPPLPQPPAGWKQIQPVGVEGLGGVVNNPNLIIDGKFLDDHTVWNDGRCVWWTKLEFEVVVDLGRPCVVDGWTIQLATDNDWVISASLNGKEYQDITRINRQDFKLRWGMETVSSLPGSPGSIPRIAFQPVEARYIKIQAVGSVYYEISVSEISVFGECGSEAVAGKK